jgi:hypothetical protein
MDVTGRTLAQGTPRFGLYYANNLTYNSKRRERKGLGIGMDIIWVYIRGLYSWNKLFSG